MRSKKGKKIPSIFSQIGVSGPKNSTRRVQTLPPPPLPILSIPFSSEIDPLGIKCLTFLRHPCNSGSQLHRGSTCVCNCEARTGSLAIPVVKSGPQQQQVRIDNGETSLSMVFCLNASLRRTPVCPCGSGMRIIFLKPLGQLFCSLPLGGGGLAQAADLLLCCSKK